MSTTRQGPIRRTLAAAGAALTLAAAGVAVDTATAAPAEATHRNQLCHRGAAGEAPVYILESDGSKYWVHPGDCTPGDVFVHGFRPVSGGWMTYRRAGDGNLRTCYAKPDRWCSTLLQDISVIHSFR